MIKEKIAEVIKERIRICEETEDNWDYGIEQCWKKYAEIMLPDIDKSIAYFLHECTDEEFYWLSGSVRGTIWKGTKQRFNRSLAFSSCKSYNRNISSAKFSIRAHEKMG